MEALEVVAVVVEVVVDVDSSHERTKAVKSIIDTLRKTTVIAIVATLLSSSLFVLGDLTPAEAQAARGAGYGSAQEAVDALVAAAEKFDETALATILGPNSNDIINTGEPARDKEMSLEFAAQARTKQSLARDSANVNRMVLSVGNDEWPFPVPLVKVGGKWYFDSVTGRDEVVLRRVGRNELDAIEICRGYVEAQNEYAMMKQGDSGVSQYAQKIISSPGKQDGLAWQKEDGTWDGPVGENVAKAIARGYTSRSEPYRGYFFQVLKGQGPAAPMGQLDYVVKGVMIGGFALIATPAHYRVTGVKTFMVSQDGVVYQKDLGPNTLEIARRIERFNPDSTWTPVLEE